MRLESEERRPALDGLRGIAILLVLVWHYANFVAPSDHSSFGYFTTLTRLCWSGVDLFFVLSGYLIGGILIDNRDSSDYWTTFYVRRACRILPLYLFVLGSFAFLSALRPAGFDWLLADGMPIWSYSTFTQNFAMADRSSFGAQFMGPTWSLAIEEQFYLILPLIVRFSSPKRLPLLLLMFVACAPISRIIIYHWFSARHLLAPYVLTLCRADALLIGVLCAWAVRQRKILDAIEQHPFVGNTALVLLTAGVVWVGLSYRNFYARGVIFFGFTLIAAFYGAILIFAIRHKHGILSRVLSSKRIGEFGRIAFGLYLLHIPVVGGLYAVLRHQEPMVANLSDLEISAVAFVVTLVIAKVSWSLFEEPLIKIGKRFRYNRSPSIADTHPHRFS